MRIQFSHRKLFFGLVGLSYLLTGLMADDPGGQSRIKRFSDEIDLEKIRKDLVDPSTISNQITGGLVWTPVLVFGWVFGGTVLES